MEDAIDKSMDNLKEEIMSLKQRLSQYRKKGIDTKIVEHRIANIPSKLMMIKVTRDPKDVQKANQLLYMAKSDAEDLEREYQEFLAYKKPESIDPAIEEIEYEINKAKQYGQGNDMASAKASYLKAYKSYNTLNDEKKKKVFEALNDLRVFLTK